MSQTIQEVHPVTKQPVTLVIPDPVYQPKTQEEFIKYHGAHIMEDNLLLFQDGARMSLDQGRGYQMLPPSENKWDRLTAIYHYYQKALEIAERKFNSFRADCVNRLQQGLRDNVPLPPPNAAAILKQGREEVLAHRAKLAELDEQLKDSPKAILRRQSEQQQRELEEVREKLRTEIEKITL